MDLNDFLRRNNISEELIFSELYTFILCNCLKKACDYLAIKSNREFFLTNYRGVGNKEKFFYNFAKNISGYKLSQTEITWFTMCVMANINKSPRRKKYDKHLINELLIKQNYKCNICGKELTKGSFHVDHIIPWDLVGDELQDNLQLLCKECNQQKSNSLHFQLQSLIKTKGEL